jgi:hypothetical protein
MAQTDSEGNTNLCCCYILDRRSMLSAGRRLLLLIASFTDKPRSQPLSNNSKPVDTRYRRAESIDRFLLEW